MKELNMHLFETWEGYKQYLQKMQERIGKLKIMKLEKRFKKYGNHDQYTFFQVYEHFINEAIEFFDGLKKSDISNMKEELLDMSSCIDMMLDILEKKGLKRV